MARLQNSVRQGADSEEQLSQRNNESANPLHCAESLEWGRCVTSSERLRRRPHKGKVQQRRRNDTTTAPLDDQ